MFPSNTYINDYLGYNSTFILPEFGLYKFFSYIYSYFVSLTQPLLSLWYCLYSFWPDFAGFNKVIPYYNISCKSQGYFLEIVEIFFEMFYEKAQKRPIPKYHSILLIYNNLMIMWVSI